MVKDCEKEVSFTSIKIDADRFEPYLNHPELSETERKELLEAVFAIVTGFIDLGFGIHPVQQACEQNEVYCEIATLDLMDLLESIPVEEKQTKCSSGNKAAFAKATPIMKGGSHEFDGGR